MALKLFVYLIFIFIFIQIYEILAFKASRTCYHMYTQSIHKDFTKGELLNDIRQLSEILEAPRLYLADYFSDLRNQVDKEISIKQMIEQNKGEKTEQLNELWKEMISKIDSFETDCIKNQLNDIDTIFNRLKSIESDLNLSGDLLELQNDLNEIKQKIKHEELNVFRNLFKNKTIIFLLTDNYKYRELIDGKLIIVNDEYIDVKQLKLR